MITVDEISTLNKWESLEAEWTTLITGCPLATPFQRPEWLLPWWRRFGSGQMTVLAFRAGDLLVGLLPAFIHLWEGRRRVTLIGNGITDYLDLTARPEYASECARLALQWFWRNRHRWDLCDWQDLQSDSPLIRARSGELEMASMPWLNGTAASVGDDPDAYGEGLPHGLRRTIRLATRRLEREGEIEFETLCSDHDASALQALFRLHEERWRDKGGPESMLDSKSVQAFLIEATRGLSARGMIRLYTMRFLGHMAAMIYGILDRNCLYGYITGMDPQLARYSVGSLLLNYAIRDAIADGARRWDFLRGEEQYKFQWGAQRAPKRRVFVWHDGIFAPVVTGEEQLEPVLG
jgi:CelD/BcsL family acetyltransferase involved in cellulose biosynthesis